MVGSAIMSVEFDDDLFNPKTLASKSEELNGVDVSYDGSKVKKDLGGPESCRFVLQFGSGVAAGVVSNWLYDRLKDSGVSSLDIGGKNVEVKEDSIQEKLDKYAGK